MYEVFNAHTGETFGFTDNSIQATHVTKILNRAGIPADYINADTDDSGWVDNRYQV